MHRPLYRLACFQAASDGITPTIKQLQVPGDLKNMLQGLDATVKLQALGESLLKDLLG